MLKSKKFTKIAPKTLNHAAKSATKNDGNEVGEQGEKDSKGKFFSFYACKIDGSNVKNGFGGTVRHAGATGDIAIDAVFLE